MKNLFKLLLLTSAMLSSTVSASQYDKFDSPLTLEEIWRSPQFSGIEISPDGKYFSAHSETEQGQSVLHIIERSTFIEVNRLQFEETKLGVERARWLSPTRVMFTLSLKRKSNEQKSGGMYLAMNVDGTEKGPLFNPVVEDGTGYGVLMGKAGGDDYYLNVYPSGDSDKFPYNYLYKVNLKTQKTRRVMKSPVRMGQFVMKGNEVTHAVGYREDSYDATVIYEKDDKNNWVKVADFHNSEGGMFPVRWSKDGSKILYEGNVDAPTTGLFWVDPKTGEKELIYRHPKVNVSAGDLQMDAAGRIWGVRIYHDYPKVVILDETHPFAKNYAMLKATFKGKSLQFKRYSASSPEYMVFVSSDTDPGKYYIFNELDGQLKYLTARYDNHDESKIGPMYPVRFNARDGLELNGYLTIPPGVEAKNLPLILLPHGGPYGPRDWWGYNREVITFTNSGYAVLQVNYRGSGDWRGTGGFGREIYYNAYRQWGLEMQDDLTDSVNWAVSQGIVDPDRVCIYGASYGGYAAMMGMAKTPDLFKCGVGYVGVYDMNIFATQGDTQLQAAGRRYFVEALGATPEQRWEQSPMSKVDRMKNPIFLVHGGQDVRVHIEHYYQLREKLLEKNHRFETLVAPRAGHGARDINSQLEIYCRVLDFVDRHIGHKKPTDAPQESCRSEEAMVPLKYEYFRGDLK
ncbi:S9 family peptidase [Thalassotalea sp. LPB0316]|uniref:alpha/beta hydrolase family protein n=1 Tax=Thalassotalea sp. LPB0316 TaxID=2769490 RepID=UPI001866F354|nr:prolyl oligopeptidase family serine peptidase [Thalassotalea sp. LPB0316]QOL26129.1 S9 family peptidase [Thalassotalea sp. LPB0316]